MRIDRILDAFRGRRDRRSEILMEETFELKVHIACDEETGRWYVAESDVPGLRLEDADPLNLIARIELAVPELVELNLGEIVAMCRAQKPDTYNCHSELDWKRPAVRPVFDSPLRPAYV